MYNVLKRRRRSSVRYGSTKYGSGAAGVKRIPSSTHEFESNGAVPVRLGARPATASVYALMPSDERQAYRHNRVPVNSTYMAPASSNANV